MRPITGSILLVAFTRASFDNTSAISHFCDSQTVGYPSHHHQCLPASKVTCIIDVDLATYFTKKFEITKIRIVRERE
ncbi:hypothetical protein HD553DRAFT_318059 [Filobasidium floriforme]|uniref:uncharacterized protein n=1 Tax=Filobasidium floriforme TaxID=5210 RepID=UPI001E8EB05F|nr:uncharacterized protein HD553DRAFT_318059 [Filobasidium floriforme]KAH8079975.1 hypothetical protein HD553DRAFT_318059 [Filobasidium floriforme]